MGSCDGLAESWRACNEVVVRLSQHGRIVVPSGSELKLGNKDAATNHMVLKPVLEEMVKNPNWELFKLPVLAKQLLVEETRIDYLHIQI